MTDTNPFGLSNATLRHGASLLLGFEQDGDDAMEYLKLMLIEMQELNANPPAFFAQRHESAP